MKLKLIAAAITLGLVCTQAYANDAMQGQNASIQTGTAATNTVDKAKQDGENFLQKNKAKPGVVTLSDGLQYKVLKKGTGPKPGPNDVVTVDYSGKLIDGTEFDSSDKHGGPSSFTVGQVIPGWVEALQLMPVGSEWELYIPASLAYGEQGSPPAIGPNETLIFKVKLIKMEKGG